MGGFPSGQRGQTVNLLQIASVVRIHLHPVAYIVIVYYIRGYGGIGRRKGLKIQSAIFIISCATLDFTGFFDNLQDFS